MGLQNNRMDGEFYYGIAAPELNDLPSCPVCGEQCETVYIYNDSGTYIGCNNCIEPIDNGVDPDAFTDCVCENFSDETDVVYRSNDTGDIIGCSECIEEMRSEDYFTEGYDEHL